MKKAIVFGGSGFLGSHVADALTARGYEVTIFDMRESPYLQKNQKMIVGSILDEELVTRSVRGQDVVYNFAAIADIDEAHKKPVDTIRHNVLGNTIILEASRQNAIKRFVYASSVYVYSQAGSFYRSSKQASELIIENYHEICGLTYTILRYGSLYGPRAGPSNWIHNILKSAITDKKIIRYGNGEELREYIHVEDAARWSVDILDPDFENKCVILTGNERMRIKDLLTMIKEMLSNKIEIEYQSEDDPGSPYGPNTHYNITPYSFNPKMAIKFVGKYHLDMGQGILQCLTKIYNELNPHEEINGFIIEERDKI